MVVVVLLVVVVVPKVVVVVELVVVVPKMVVEVVVEVVVVKWSVVVVELVVEVEHVHEVLVVVLVVVELVVDVVVVVEVEHVHEVLVVVLVIVELVVVDVVVDVVVVLVVDVVVELVVVVVTGQLGSPGCIVQVQVPALHWARIDDLQALRAAPDKPAHPAAISSAHAFEPQIEGAALAPETKTPAPSATAANVTPALRVIVEPPYGRSNPKIDFGALPPRGHFSTRLSRGKSRRIPAMTTPRAAGARARLTQCRAVALAALGRELVDPLAQSTQLR